jgi:hypothetical protein
MFLTFANVNEFVRVTTGLLGAAIFGIVACIEWEEIIDKQ